MSANLIAPDIDPIVYATAKDETTPTPKYYYFTAYQFRLDGAWYATNLYADKEEARKAASDKAIIRRKICCVYL